MSIQSVGTSVRPKQAAASSRRPAPPADQTTVPVPRGERADPRRWRALAVTQLAAFMTLLDVSIVNVALPSMERGLAHRRGPRSGSSPATH